MEEYLKLEGQICFPLYVCSKEIIRKYKPFLEELNLTYTQYITMLVLWEVESINVTDLGERLYLDSGTLTPFLKKLETKGYITRKRGNVDERNLIVTITEKGLALKEKAKPIPWQLASYVKLEKEEVVALYKISRKLMNALQDKKRD